jgi:cellulose synthase/poly-beta-1,6-N-acetylglucosamine synthase-like glycosyltransferase
MISWTELAMLAILLVLAYIYLGYPLLLCLLARLFPKRHASDPGHLPSVTLMISAHNEVEIIGTKIENSLHLDYPADRLDIVVVSDSSDDGTDEVVRGYQGKGVRLIRSLERRGKTAALNGAMATVESEIVVFSDANAIYDAKAIRFLVRHFADAAVGYVVGHARYQEEQSSAAGASEEAYWDFEVLVKRCESDFSSVVGGDGAIYAIRRHLYEPMLESDINDFVNPLQIVARGYRGIFDPEAFCCEHPAGEFRKEFSRKVRIVNRSFGGFLRVPRAADPFCTGRFAWQLVSHKLMRWFSPFFMLLFLLFFALDLMLYRVGLFDRLLLYGCTLFLLLGAGGWLFKHGSRAPALFFLPYYFILVNVASARGVLMRLQGRTITTWSTVREEEGGQRYPLAPRVVMLLSGVVLFLVSSGWSGLPLPPAAIATLLFVTLAYTFFGYPYLLAPLGRRFGNLPDADENHLPTVTLLIVAYNEAKVIEEKIKNSLALEYPRDSLRIVIASDGSTDGTDAIVSRFSAEGIGLFSFPRNRGKISALNDAMSRIDSEIVVLSDANVYYQPTAIRKLVRNFADPRVGAVSGKVLLLNKELSYGDAEKAYYSIQHLVQEGEGRMGTLIGADGAMYAIRRSLFTPPAPDTILDDLQIAMGIARQGYLVLFEKEAVGFEENLLELEGEFRRKVRISAGGYQYLLRASFLPAPGQFLLMFCLFSHKILRWTSGLLMLALLCVLFRIQVQGGNTERVFFGGVAVMLLLGLVTAQLVHLFPALSRIKLAGHCRYFLMLLIASLLGCYLGVAGKQTVRWKTLPAWQAADRRSS